MKIFVVLTVVSFLGGCNAFLSAVPDFFRSLSSGQASIRKYSLPVTEPVSNSILQNPDKAGGQIWSEIPAEYYVFMESRYYFNAATKNWTESWNKCVQLGGSLADIQSQQENDFVTSTIHQLVFLEAALNGTFWIGGYDVGDNGTYIWAGIDIPVTYHDYYTGEPQTLMNERCLGLCKHNGYDHKWGNGGCHIKLNYICKFPE